MKLLNHLFCVFILLFSLQSRAQTEEKLLILPMLGYSDEMGLGLGANAAWLNAQGSTWSASMDVLASSLYSQLSIGGNIKNKKLFDVLYAEIGGHYYKSNRALFYGLGNSSSLADAAQYSTIDGNIYGRVGFNFFENFAFGVGYGRRSTSIDNGADPLIQQLSDRFATSPRLSGTTTTSTHVFAQYDTRAPQYSAKSGLLVFTMLEQAQPRSNEDLALQRYVLHGQYFTELLGNKDLILATRAKYEKVWGEDIPFYLKSRLGGVSSLRANRTNRFTDAGSILFNVEPRWTFWETNNAFFERFDLSLGLDTGRVFDYESVPPIPLIDGYKMGWTVGITGLLSGGVPIRLDYATGPEGNLIYLHLFNPF